LVWISNGELRLIPVHSKDELKKIRGEMNPGTQRDSEEVQNSHASEGYGTNTAGHGGTCA
jgi:hypothetical protein